MYIFSVKRPLYFTRYINGDFLKNYYNTDYYLNNNNRFNHYILTHTDNFYKSYLF
jgi:hypothetical protein